MICVQRNTSYKVESVAKKIRYELQFQCLRPFAIFNIVKKNYELVNSFYYCEEKNSSLFSDTFKSTTMTQIVILLKSKSITISGTFEYTFKSITKSNSNTLEKQKNRY